MAEQIAPTTVSTTRKAGRPTILTPEFIAAAEQSLAAKHPIVTTCGLLDISQETWYSWIARAHEDRTKGVESIHTQFLSAVKRGQAKAQADVIARIQHFADDNSNSNNWLPNAWLGERLWPDLFGRRDRVSVDKTTTSNIRIEYVEVRRPALGPVIEGEVREIPAPQTDTPIDV